MRLDLVNFRGVGLAGSSASLLAEWRVGAVLEAIAVRDARNGQLWLDIGGQRHPARIASGESQGPQHGEKLQVRILRNSPVLALETLSSSNVIADADASGLEVDRVVCLHGRPAGDAGPRAARLLDVRA
jgi:hypothetical protein